MSDEKVKDRGRVKVVGYFIVAMLLVGGLGFGGGFQYALATTTAGTWDGTYFTELYGNFTTGLRLAWIATGRVLYTTTGGAITSNAAFTFISNVLRVPNAVISGDVNATRAFLGNTTISGDLHANSVTATTDMNTTNLYIDSWIYLNGENCTDRLYYPEQFADYIIFTDGAASPTTYYLKTCSTGEVTTGSDAGILIQTAITALNTTVPLGGWIHIMGGNYTINAHIDLCPYLKITGETQFRTRLNMKAGANDNMFQAIGDHYYGEIEFRDLYMYGRKASQTQGTAIYMYPGSTGSNGIYDPGLYNLFIDDWKTFGTYISKNPANPGGGWAGRIAYCIYENSATALYLQGASDIRIINNKFIYNMRGILIDGGNSNNLMGNFFYHNEWASLQIRVNGATGSLRNVVEGNIFQQSSYGNAGVYNDIYLQDSDNGIFTGNSFYGVDQKSAIELQSASSNNYIGGNRYSGTYSSGYVVDAGTNTATPTITIPFISGTSFTSADADPWGWEIDSASEYAAASGFLSNEFQQLLSVRVVAVANVTETHGMMLTIAGRGGAVNEPITTESIDVANCISTTTNFAANDYIIWTITSADDADLGHLAANDYIMWKITYNAASGDNCATDGILLYLVIKYI